MCCSHNHFHAHFDEVDIIHKQLQDNVTISIILSTSLNRKKYEHINTTVTLLLHRMIMMMMMMMIIIIIIRIQHILNYPVLMVGRWCIENCETYIIQNIYFTEL